MPNRCIAGKCSNVTGLHKFPDKESDRQRWRDWVTFINTKRSEENKKNWKPTPSSRLCSDHFTDDCFERPYISVPETEFAREARAMLKNNAVPTILNPGQTTPRVDGRQERSRRRAVRELLTSRSPNKSRTHEREETAEESCEAEMFSLDDPAEHVVEEQNKVNKSCQTVDLCLECKNLSSQVRQLKNKIIDLKRKVDGKDDIINQQKETIDSLESKLQSLETSWTKEHSKRQAQGEWDGSSDEDDMGTVEEEPISKRSQDDVDYEAASETESEQDSSDEQPTNFEANTTNASDNLSIEPKFVVFLDQLLGLFHFCPNCKQDNPIIKTSVLGTMIQVTTHCVNPSCKKPDFTWRSQPNMTGTKMPAGNVLLCFSTLISGASPSKVFQVFKHMGLSCISLRTYFRHQTSKLFPTIHIFWKNYQEQMMEKLRSSEKSLVIA